VYDTPAGPVVAVVTERRTPDPKAFDGQREAVEGRLRRQKESQVEGAWLRSLRKDANVAMNQELLAAAAQQQQ
jgi:hypothetical protein